jgi:hypothetical protein
MRDKLALVAGANGIIGKALFEEIESTPGWRGRALSRKPHVSADAIACDLSDNEGTRRALEAAKDFTHVFYAAFAPGGGLAGENRLNGAMLRNLLDRPSDPFSFPRCVAAAAKMTVGPAISISHGLTLECSRNTLGGICSRSLDRKRLIVFFQSSSASHARFRIRGVAAIERHSGQLSCAIKLKVRERLQSSCALGG